MKGWFKGEKHMSIRNNFPITECPYCGGTYITIRQYIHGYGEYYVNIETGEIDSTELHSGLIYKNTKKYAICTDCNKRLFKVNDNLNVIE